MSQKCFPIFSVSAPHENILWILERNFGPGMAVTWKFKVLKFKRKCFLNLREMSAYNVLDWNSSQSLQMKAFFISTANISSSGEPDSVQHAILASYFRKLHNQTSFEHIVSILAFSGQPVLRNTVRLLSPSWHMWTATPKWSSSKTAEFPATHSKWILFTDITQLWLWKKLTALNRTWLDLPGFLLRGLHSFFKLCTLVKEINMFHLKFLMTVLWQVL